MKIEQLYSILKDLCSMEKNLEDMELSDLAEQISDIEPEVIRVIKNWLYDEFVEEHEGS